VNVISNEIIKTNVALKLTQDESQQIFKCDLGDMNVKDCYIDEVHKTEGDMLGPNPSRMLALAVLGCLSASFIFCLKKRNLKVDDYRAEAEVLISRNEKGFWRVTKINVNIEPKISDPEALKRAKQCLKKVGDDFSFFEEYCLVTQAVREGIEIDVNVDI